MKTCVLMVLFGFGLFFQVVAESAVNIKDGSFWIFTDSNSKRIYCTSNSSEKAYHMPVNRILNPIAIHYNEITEKLYWSDVSLKEIRSISIDKADDMLLLSLDSNSIPDGLAVDETYNLLFFSDAGNRLITLLDLEGFIRVDVITTHCNQPRAIVLDSDKGKMYWTDWGIVPKIESANYDGTNRTEILKTRLFLPNALSVDFTEKWMYWGDAGTHNIERAKLDGTQRQVIFHDPKGHFFSLIVEAGVIFYTDWQHRSMMSLKVDGTDNRPFGQKMFGRLNDLTHIKQKPKSPRNNVCMKQKESCSHICLPKPNGKRLCLCPAGYTLQNDTHCIAGSAGHLQDTALFFIVTDTIEKRIFCTSNSSEKTYHIPVQRISTPIAVHYDEITKKLYWSDVSLKEIRRTSVGKADDMLILSLDNNSIPAGLAVDETYNLLFFSDAGNHLIAVLDLDRLSRIDVITTHCDQPRAIVLDSDNGKMYWTDWGMNPKIESSNYDGTNRKAIIKTGLLLPNALFVDFTDKWIYWGDAGTHNIERAKLDGSQRQVIFHDPKGHFFSLIVEAGVIFYTDWQHRSMMSVKIDGKENRPFGQEMFGRLNDLTRLKQKPKSPRKNSCKTRKESCSHICFPKPNKERLCLCPEGYTLQNDTYCIAACTALPSVSHTASPSECTTSTVRVGTVCNLECKNGFSGGKTTLQCDQNGHWNNSFQKCTDEQAPVIQNCPLTQIMYAKKSNTTLSVTWQEIIANDNSGIKPTVTEFVRSGTYFPEGFHTVTIMAVDHKGLFSICQFYLFVKVLRCGSVPVPANSYITSTWCQDHYGAYCNISCFPGYRFRNNSNIAKIECGLDKDNKTGWKSDELSCEPILCPELFHAPSVLLSGCNDPYIAGSVCELECVAGYNKIQGSGVRICKPEGAWSGQDLLCHAYIAEQNTNNVLAICIATAAIIVSMLMMACGILIYLNRTATSETSSILPDSVRLASDEADNSQ